MKSLTSIFSSYSRLKTAKPLHVGDKVPNLIFKNMLNYPKERLSLAEIKNTLVIIVFWKRTCTACLNNVPVFAQLQSQYPRRVFFMLCTDDTKENVEQFIRRRKEIKDAALPTCIDTTGRIKKYFPHVQVPHVVWIGEGRRVKAITTAEHVTAENIVVLLITNRLHLPVKQDAPHFNVNRSFAENGVAANEGVFFESHLTGYLPGIHSQCGYCNNEQFNRIYAVNVSRAALYALAYRYEEHLHEAQLPVRMLFEQKEDRRLFFQRTNDASPPGEESLLSYELLLPPEAGFKAECRAHLLMQRDLDRYFNCISNMKCLLRDCYEVVPANREPVPSSASSYQEESIREMIFFNQPVSEVINYVCNSFTAPLPLVCDDKTTKITIRLKKNYDEWEALHKDLTDGGLILQPTQRYINMLLFSRSEEQAIRFASLIA